MEKTADQAAKANNPSDKSHEAARIPGSAERRSRSVGTPHGQTRSGRWAPPSRRGRSSPRSLPGPGGCPGRSEERGAKGHGSAQGPTCPFPSPCPTALQRAAPSRGHLRVRPPVPSVARDREAWAGGPGSGTGRYQAERCRPLTAAGGPGAATAPGTARDSRNPSAGFGWSSASVSRPEDTCPSGRAALRRAVCLRPRAVGPRTAPAGLPQDEPPAAAPPRLPSAPLSPLRPGAPPEAPPAPRPRRADGSHRSDPHPPGTAATSPSPLPAPTVCRFSAFPLPPSQAPRISPPARSLERRFPPVSFPFAHPSPSPCPAAVRTRTFLSPRRPRTAVGDGRSRGGRGAAGTQRRFAGSGPARPSPSRAPPALPRCAQES
ncbi:vegetative cell wall protein gp1-like isoform X1 [Gallus gallus]|uniref:vegetative cell wall protein gp1-like isoform X1 n=1 Tax=Gallus gallus TaxID=9031 RepID=UPI001AE7098D|nr:vegetative cell wall protein gp1-like isoform X1 [Gallus gallus]